MLPSSKLSGRGFTISWSAGNALPVLSWNRKYSNDNPGGDTLLPSVMLYLAQYCLPHMVDGKQRCRTEFLCGAGHKYRAHPSIYNSKAWHDHAMVTWQGCKYPLPALIHTFVDLRDLPPSSRIILRATGQPPIKAGVYALIHSFDAIKEKATRNPTNVMIGRYKLHLNDKDSTPTLYMVGVHNLVSPTIGICDIGSSLSPEDEHYLFLFRRKEEWALSWDSMINSCYASRDSPSIEEDYEVAAINDSNNDDSDEDSDEEDSDDDNDEDDGVAKDDDEDSGEEQEDDVDNDESIVNNDNNSDSDGDEVRDEDVSSTEVTPQPRKKKQRR